MCTFGRPGTTTGTWNGTAAPGIDKVAFGFVPPHPFDTLMDITDTPLTRTEQLIDKTRANIELAQRHQKHYHDKTCRPLTFQVGEYAYLARWAIRQLPGTTKLARNYFGPFKVVRSIKDIAYELDLPHVMRRIHPVFHVEYLKKARSDDLHLNPVFPRPSAVLPDDADEADCILDHRYRYNQPQFLIRWTNCPGEDSWVKSIDAGIPLVDEHMKTPKWNANPLKIKYVRDEDGNRARIFY